MVFTLHIATTCKLFQASLVMHKCFTHHAATRHPPPPCWEPMTHIVLQSHTSPHWPCTCVFFFLLLHKVCCYLTHTLTDRAYVFIPHTIRSKPSQAITDSHRTTASMYGSYPATSMMYSCVCESIWSLVKDSSLLEYATGKAIRLVYIWQYFIRSIQYECHA